MQANRTEQALCGNSITNYQLCTAPARARVFAQVSHLSLTECFRAGLGENGIGAGAAAAAAGGVTDGSCVAVGWMAVT